MYVLNSLSKLDRDELAGAKTTWQRDHVCSKINCMHASQVVSLDKENKLKTGQMIHKLLRKNHR